MRALIAESRGRHSIDRERVSFKGCVNLVRTWAPVIAAAESETRQQDMLDLLLYYISRKTVKSKAGRSEPELSPEPIILVNRPQISVPETPCFPGALP